VIAVDTNILVYAHRADSPHHVPARQALRRLAEGARAWAVPWPCVHEFLAVVTHPRIYRPPSSTEDALGAVEDLLRMPRVAFLAEAVDHALVLSRLMTAAPVIGPKVHDARVAAICLSHGVSELWTADRDFSYFPDLVTRNPLVS
jgi:toxin-antitoxin system PIN domain toxin